MIVYDGTYRAKAGETQKPAPISQWRWAWRIRIINLAIARPDVEHLKPIVVVAIPEGPKPCLASCAETIGQNIRRDFNLKISKVFWIEMLPATPDYFSVATFVPKFRFGHEFFYHIRWRPIRPNEEQTIKPFIMEES